MYTGRLPLREKRIVLYIIEKRSDVKTDIIQ